MKRVFVLVAFLVVAMFAGCTDNTAAHKAATAEGEYIQSFYDNFEAFSTKALLDIEAMGVAQCDLILESKFTQEKDANGMILAERALDLFTQYRAKVKELRAGVEDIRKQVALTKLDWSRAKQINEVLTDYLESKNLKMSDIQDAIDSVGAVVTGRKK